MPRPLLLPLFLCFSFPLSLYSLAQTVLVPVDVYVGDRAIIRHSFSAGTKLSGIKPGETLELSPESEVFAALEPDYTVTAATLTQNDAEYLLTIHFIPWKTGEFDIPAFELDRGTEERENREIENREKSFAVDVGAVMIASLAQKLGESQIRPPAPPVIVPGTTYILLGIVAAAAGILAGTVTVLVRLRKSGKSLTTLFNALFYSKAGRRALKALRVLMKRIASAPPTLDAEKELAGSLQVILRDYLDAHFGWPFRAASSPELFPAFADITSGMMDSEHFAQVEKLDALFRRCDFLRYAAGAENTGFVSAELSSLVAEAQGIVIFFEQGE
ncbi:MAG: hypothetical protein LBS97_02645 [Treponema sp.]|jgi:hypothetical protein|nr:hypothetical protein [Treponema sp.]